MISPSKCEREGFLAASSRADRQSNPYDVVPQLGDRPWAKKVQRDMAAAWWRGWGKAIRQLGAA
jgi:hypothetical protein